jgi:signal-induced proliferation-associated 1 like protein 3
MVSEPPVVPVPVVPVPVVPVPVAVLPVPVAVPPVALPLVGWRSVAAPVADVLPVVAVPSFLRSHATPKIPSPAINVALSMVLYRMSFLLGEQGR